MSAVKSLLSVLTLAILADAVPSDIAYQCPGLQPLSVVPGSNIFNNKRWHLYESTSITAPPDVPAYCGPFDTASGNCKCIFFDAFMYGGTLFNVKYGYDIAASRLDSHLVKFTFLSPDLAAYTYTFDYRNNSTFTAVNPASDDYTTYFISVACNTQDPPFNGNAGVWVFTASAFPSEDTKQAIADALAINNITAQLIPSDQYGCEHIYPASTYTTPESQYFIE